MSVKIKYGTDGFQGAEISLDPKSIQDGKAREDYLAIHTFLTGILGSQSVSAKKHLSADEGKLQAPNGSHPHNKSRPHFRADRKMAKFIINGGGIKYLHGVNVVDNIQVFFFDKSPKVQKLIALYNEQNPADSTDAADVSKKSHGKKSVKKPKQKAKDTDIAPTQTIGEQPETSEDKCAASGLGDAVNGESASQTVFSIAPEDAGGDGA